MSKSDQIIWYGTSQPGSKETILRAGNLDIVFEEGFIRYIKSGEQEILRMVNHRVRDHNWGTVPQRIFDEKTSGGQILLPPFGLSFILTQP